MIKTQNLTTASLIMLSSLLWLELNISKCLFLFSSHLFLSAWELYSNVWIWFTNCIVTPSVSGRREQGESPVCRNGYLRSLILKLRVHWCICSQNNSALRYFSWDTIHHGHACEQPKHTGLTGKEMKTWIALTSSDFPRARELHKDYQICRDFFAV